MAKNRYVNTKFWDDKYSSGLDPIEKLLFLYFLTNPLTNLIGIYEIELRRIAFDTGIDKEMVQKIIDRFTHDKKVYYSDGYLIIKNFIKFQNEGSPKIKKGIEVALAALPEKIKKLNSDLLKGIDTLSHSNTNTNSNTNSNLNSNSNSNLIKDLPEKTPVEIFPKLNSLQTELKTLFEDYYKSKKNIKYYYDGKSAGALKKIINKIKNFAGEENNSNEHIINAFKYILINLNDEWVIENLDLPNLNSKFNQIISKIKNGQTNTSKHGASKGFDRGKNTWIDTAINNYLQSTGTTGDNSGA